jgi:hypothetical protein
MVQKLELKKKAQVSIEILLLASIILLISVSVFSYYTSIRDSTIGIELIKVRGLEQIEDPEIIEGLMIIEKIDYKIDTMLDTVFFCIFTDPDDTLWDADEELLLEQEIVDLTGFTQTIDIQQNPDDPSPCE